MTLAASSLAAAVAFGACANQSEGEICDTNAGNGGNDDCKAGLICTQISVNGARCCPADRVHMATTAACSVGGSFGLDASTAPPGSVTSEAGVDGGAAQTVSDASDAGGEGAAAAPTDGGATPDAAAE